MTPTRTWRVAFVEEPARLIASQPAQVGISALSMLLTAIYFASPLLAVPWLHNWIIYAVTGAAALGVEYAFLKGIADRAYIETHGGSGFWGDVLVYTTSGLLIIGGSTVLLTYAYEVPGLAQPKGFLAAFLALAHVAPLAVIGVCSAQLHASAERTAAALAQRAVEREAAANRSFEDRKRAIDLEVYEGEQKALARGRVRAAQSYAQPRTGTPAHGPHAAARSPARAMSRDELCAAVRAAYTAHANFSRAELARRSGWSEAMVRKVLAEILSSKDAS